MMCIIANFNKQRIAVGSQAGGLEPVTNRAFDVALA